MRKVKFRAWDKDENRMIPWDELTYYDDDLYGEWWLMSAFAHDSMIFQQFTGLTDKHGEEIYEGDIYKYIIQVHYGAKYSEFECKDVVRYEYGAFWVGDHLLIDALENDDEAEIIGNIYENPELLGV